MGMVLDHRVGKSYDFAFILPISIFVTELTPWCRVLLEKIIVVQLVKKYPAFYGTRRFIIVFKKDPL
jgi:hypothetical protein